MNCFQRFLYKTLLGFCLGILHQPQVRAEENPKSEPAEVINPDDQKLLDNVDHIIKKLPDKFEFYKYDMYRNSALLAVKDLCLYDWRLLGKDYQQKKLSRADLNLLWGDESKDCRFFPYYDHQNDSPRELFINQSALMENFADRELIRLMEKCQPEYHDFGFFKQITELPKERWQAYIDDCLDHGHPFLLWNPDYSNEDTEIYGDWSNYITTKFLVSPNRLLNAIMYTYTSIFSIGTSTIFYDQSLTDKVFEIDQHAMSLSLTIIYNILLPMPNIGGRRESLEKLERLSFSVIRKFPKAQPGEFPEVVAIPTRIISKLILSEFYSFDEVVKLSEDELFMRAGFHLDMPKYLGDYFKENRDFERAIKFYRMHQIYQGMTQDFYFKDRVDTNICLSYIALGKIPNECIKTLFNHIARLNKIASKSKTDKVNSDSIRDLANLTVLQQDTINLNAKIRQYFYILIGLSSIMALLIFFLFSIQKSLRRKNILIDEQKKNLEQRNDKIQEQKDSIQLILDEVADVILKFDRDGQALPYSSKAAKNLFQDIDTTNIFQWVKQYFTLPEDEIGLIQEVLRSVLNEPQVAWELNASHLPQEVKLCGLPFAIEWTPIVRDDITCEILISARNLIYLRQVESLRAEQNLILALVQGGAKSMRWVRELPSRLAAWMKLTQGEERNRLLHTIKGEARTLQLASIVEHCHRLEQVLRDGGSYQGVLDELQQSALRAAEAVGHLEQGQGSALARENILDIVHRLRKEAKQAMAPLGFQVSIALDVNLEVENPHTQDLVAEILLHAVNNSLDHGFVRPRQQGKQTGKDIVIAIQVQGDEHKLRLQIADNGLGLDEGKLRQLADARHWQPEAGRPWTDIVFESGVSTAAETVTDRSGRGVGLSAIKHAARELGLRPRLQSRPDGRPGTLLVIE